MYPSHFALLMMSALVNKQIIIYVVVWQLSQMLLIHMLLAFLRQDLVNLLFMMDLLIIGNVCLPLITVLWMVIAKPIMQTINVETLPVMDQLQCNV